MLALTSAKTVCKKIQSVPKSSQRFFSSNFNELWISLSIADNVPKYTSVEEAVKLIKSNDRVFVHGMAATPNTLLDVLILQHLISHDIGNG
jgi:hypothetical protein